MSILEVNYNDLCRSLCICDVYFFPQFFSNWYQEGQKKVSEEGKLTEGVNKIVVSEKEGTPQTYLES